MEENTNQNEVPSINNSQKQIAGAIIMAGVLIAGAILINGSQSAPQSTSGASSVAKEIGLNVRNFDACMTSGKFADKVQADIDDGTSGGIGTIEEIRGTPSSFILKDGKVVGLIGGAQQFDTVKEKISSALLSNTPLEEIKIRPVTEGDHIVGDINTAKIIIVEYSDFDCPFCKVFHSTMHRVVKDSNGEVAWVYRHYPIPQLHPDAFKKAEATECAWEQGGNEAFWKYADRLFEINQ